MAANMEPSPPLSSSDELFVYLLRSKPPRIHEALWIAEHALYLLRAECAASELAVARMEDDRLEEAVRLRDEMRNSRTNANLRFSLTRFLDKYPNITYLPLIKSIPGVEACAARALVGISSLGGARNVFGTISSLTSAVNMMKNLALTAERIAFAPSHCCCPSEVLLHSALVDLSRLALHSLVLRHSRFDDETSNFVIQLLNIVRCTSMHKVSEDVRAVVSLACAELLAFYDAMLPPSVAIPTIDRRCQQEQDVCCFLTGARAADADRMCVCVAGAERAVTIQSGMYWHSITN